MATQPAIWFPLRESCGHCPEARGRPRMGGMRLEHGTSHSCLSLQRGHSGPSNHKSPETLVFVFTCLSLRKLPRRENGAASQGSREAGAGGLEEQCQLQTPTTCNAPVSGAETPQAAEPRAGMTLGGRERDRPILSTGGPRIDPSGGAARGQGPKVGKRGARRTERRA